jgi:hypothetical protein
MSKGRPAVAVRFDEAEIALMDAWINKVNQSRSGEPYTRVSFIRSCVVERFAKLERAKASAQRRKVKGTGGGIHPSVETATHATHEVISNVAQ